MATQCVSHLLDCSQIPTLPLLCLRLQRASACNIHFPVSFVIWLWKALVEDWKVGSKEMSGYFSPSLFWEATQVVAVSPWLQILLDSPHLPICLLCSSTTLVTNSLCQTPSVEPSNNCCFPHQTPTNTARLWIICGQFSVPLLYTLVCILNLISTKRRKWKARERRTMNCQRLSITLAKSKSQPIFPSALHS